MPAWIEATWHEHPATLLTAPEAVDWIVVEDHTDPSRGGRVSIYHHLTVWHGRAVATVTVRHELGLDLDEAVARAASSALAALHAASGLW